MLPSTLRAAEVHGWHIIRDRHLTDIDLDEYRVIVAPLYACIDFLGHGRTVPHIIPFGPASEMSRALFLGAADYLCEPFEPAELLARAAAVCSKGKTGAPDILGRTLVTDRLTTVLTGGQRDLLELFVSNEGRVVDRAAIRAVTGSRSSARDSRAADMAVARLRRVIGEGGYRIESVPNRGYRLTRS
jgi:DNA-binding response OmpR family regulator